MDVLRGLVVEWIRVGFFLITQGSAVYDQNCFEARSYYGIRVYQAKPSSLSDYIEKVGLQNLELISRC